MFNHEGVIRRLDDRTKGAIANEWYQNVLSNPADSAGLIEWIIISCGMPI